MKSSIFRNAGLDNETLTQLTRLLIPYMVVAIPFKISNIHWPVCGYYVSAIEQYLVVWQVVFNRFKHLHRCFRCS